MTAAATAGLAVITGAGSPTGIGFAVARALGAAGHALLVASTTARIQERVAELREAGMQARGVACDLSTEDGVAELTATAGDGVIDVLVNNAGMAVLGEMDELAALEDVTLAQWQRSFERNLTTAFLVTRAVLPRMKARGFGRIVNVSSTTGAVSAVAGDTAYAAAKAGLLGFTRAVALEGGWRPNAGRSVGHAGGSREPRRLAGLAFGVVRDRPAHRRGRRQLRGRGPERSNAPVVIVSGAGRGLSRRHPALTVPILLSTRDARQRSSSGPRSARPAESHDAAAHGRPRERRDCDRGTQGSHRDPSLGTITQQRRPVSAAREQALRGRKNA